MAVLFHRRVFLPLVLILLATASVFCQQNVTGASVSGVVSDTTGAVIPGASITITNIATNNRLSSISNENGTYTFNYIPVGDYQLRFEKAGFHYVLRTFSATVGQSLVINGSLPVNGVAVLVDVNDHAPVIEQTRTQLPETVTSKNVDELPLNGRNFLDLALLLPNVSRTNTGNVQKFAETSAVPGTGISVSGQRNLNNSFIVDGSSANDDSVELAGTFYSQEVVREFQVVTNGAVAEYGRASSGFISILTWSGSNDMPTARP